MWVYFFYLFIFFIFIFFCMFLTSLTIKLCLTLSFNALFWVYLFIYLIKNIFLLTMHGRHVLICLVTCYIVLHWRERYFISCTHFLFKAKNNCNSTFQININTKFWFSKQINSRLKLSNISDILHMYSDYSVSFYYWIFK